MLYYCVGKKARRSKISVNQSNMKQIPNLFTLLNLFFGCCAIVFVMQNGITIAANESGSEWVIMPEEIWKASLFIALAAVVDFLDGFVARLFKATSELGKQLDSLADLVSFGVAPSLIVFHFLRLSFARQDDGLDISWWLLTPAFIIACAAAFRLATFNLATDQQYGFKGVPTPAVGLLIASLPIIYWYSESETVIGIFQNKWFWYAVILVLSWLMVSKLPLMALKFKDFSVKNNLPKILLLLIAVLSGIFLQWMAVPITFLAYIILSLAFKNKTT
jgi:CDP-diacylglycerol---serine O-phosphatidyltransferase